MFKYLLLLLLLSFITSFNLKANDNLLTIQQQLERLQREVSDLSQTVFSNENNSQNNETDNQLTNFSALDMRLYDLERDLKNLTGNIEEMFFQFEDIVVKIKELENVVLALENNILEFKKNDNNNINEVEVGNEIINNQVQQKDDNTLGSLKITKETQSDNEENNSSTELNTETNKIKQNPEDQFQSAFDNIRNKNWDDARESLIQFIKEYPENQLSGSAHYWLGELYILEKKYRDAALVFAEGYQKFPNSIKAPDMLFKLSQSLYEVQKISESCKTLEKLILDYPKNKFLKSANKNMQDFGCLDISE